MAAPRVAVLVPARDFVDTFWAFDYSRLLVTTKHLRPDITQYYSIATGASLSRQREELADYALGTDATHLLWLDSDMRFPPDAFLRLLAHKLPAVCASYTTRSAPHKPLAFTDPLDWEQRVWPTPESTGLVPIVACGFGCVLFERHVFERMAKPRFSMPWVEAGPGGYMQEDLFFFLKMGAELKDVRLMLDQDLTKDIAHIGRAEYTAAHAVQGGTC